MIKPTKYQIDNLLNKYKGCSDRIMSSICRFLINFKDLYQISTMLRRSEGDIMRIINENKRYYYIYFDVSDREIKEIDLLNNELINVF